MASKIGERVGQDMITVGTGAVARALVGRVPIIGPALTITAAGMMRSEVDNIRKSIINSEAEKRSAVREGKNVKFFFKLKGSP